MLRLHMASESELRLRLCGTGGLVRHIVRASGALSGSCLFADMGTR